MKGRIRMVSIWLVWKGWMFLYSLSWNLENCERRIASAVVSSREKFATECSEALMDDVGGNGVYDQNDFASYLSGLCRDRKLCEDGEALSFESLPVLVQMKFAWTICPKGNETAFEACVDELQDHPDKPIDIDITNSPNFAFELCYSAYSELFEMGLAPQTSAPTPSPSTSALTSVPTSAPTSAHSSAQTPPSTLMTASSSTLKSGLSDRSIAGISLAAAGVVFFAGAFALYRQRKKASPTAAKEEAHSPRTDATNKSHWVDDSVSSIGFEEDDDPIRHMEQAVLSRDWKKVADLAAELSSIDSASASLSSEPTFDLHRLDELIQAGDWNAVFSTAHHFSTANENDDRCSPTQSHIYYSKPPPNATYHQNQINLNVIASTSAVFAKNKTTPSPSDSTPSVTPSVSSTAQNDCYSGDHLSSVDSTEQIQNPQHYPIIIEGSYRSRSSNSSSPNRRQKSWKKKLSFARRKKTDDDQNIKMALALQEDSSVSSWSNGSSPGNSACFKPSPINEDTSFYSSDDNDKTSVKSAVSLRDELDRAIESGDWAAVETHTALILDDETNKNDTDHIKTDHPDEIINDVSNSNIHSSNTEALTVLNSCKSQNEDSSLQHSPPRINKLYALEKDIESNQYVAKN